MDANCLKLKRFQQLSRNPALLRRMLEPNMTIDSFFSHALSALPCMTDAIFRDKVFSKALPRCPNSRHHCKMWLWYCKMWLWQRLLAQQQTTDFAVFECASFLKYP
ncbi:hypothetical protein KR51_00017810 [Rubidibacter lacunae KORDI 51-2]|uniref:Uncharacterized protein n=1 Tax=Rubidibacter lacunae KORDI 51-2 TaxID=582515 RepID=U5DAH1_9CHRO|nr:hypothetical protein KR51_00017810 [Rubidibacter lacunae KORDI 51-2]